MMTSRAQKRSLEDISVDCSELNEHFQLPLVTDDLNVIADEMERLARVGADKRDCLQIARAGLIGLELEMYDAWASGTRMPHFDWINSRPAPTGRGSAKRYQKHAAAIDIIWNHEGATPENASWLVQNMILALPLVKAVTRMLRALITLFDGTQELTELELAEIQTTRKIVNAAMCKYNGEVSGNFQNASASGRINRAGLLIKARERAMRERAMKFELLSLKKKKVMIHLERQQPAVLPVKVGTDDYNQEHKRQGRDHFDLLANTGLRLDHISSDSLKRLPAINALPSKRRRLQPEAV